MSEYYEFSRVGKTAMLSPISIERESLTSFLKVYNEIREEKDSAELTLYVRGGGGDLDTVFSIYDMLKNDEINRTVLIGRAKSAHVILLCAGKIREMMPNASIGLHPCLSGGENGADNRTLKRIIEDASWYDKRYIEVLTVNSRRPFTWWHDRYMMGNEQVMEFLYSAEIMATGLAELILPPKLL